MFDDPASPARRRPVYCFNGRNGDLPVAGLDWSFTSDDFELEPIWLANCVSVIPSEVGIGSFRVIAPGRSLEVELTVVEAEETSRSRPLAEWRTDLAAASGWRARAVVGEDD